ncbi:MAG: endonuclease/exonuclease/phosphatase family protein [Clostridia bacterium]|nr:endonuclease/exonuclease/phosphatase family protein [Clostridia bacterium]
MFDNELKIGSWNVGSMLSDIERNLHFVKETIKEHNPDVICFQEFPDIKEIREEILNSVGYGSSVFKVMSESHVAPGLNVGLFVCSKYELTSSIIHKLLKPITRVYYNGNEEFWHDKFFLKTGISLNGMQVAIVTGHSFPFYRYKLDEKEYDWVFNSIEDWIIDCCNESTFIVAADFNSGNPMDYMSRISQHNVDAFYGQATRPSGRKTDAIIIPNGFIIKSKINETIESKNAAGRFDHNFLMLHLAL